MPVLGICERTVWCEDRIVKVCYPRSGNIHWISGFPEDVVSWVCNTKAGRVVSFLLSNKNFSKHLSNPGSIRSLILLLYARCKGVPPYKIAKNLGTHPEQLYRMERALKSKELYLIVLSALGCT